jgi:C4-dicarboxylate transporter
MNQTIKNTIKSIVVALGAVTIHHFCGKLLDYKENQEAEIKEQEHKNTIIEQLNSLHDKVEKIGENKVIQEQLNIAVNNCNEISKNIINAVNNIK